MKIKPIVIISLLFLSTFASITSIKAATPPTLRVNVTLIQTYANGSFSNPMAIDGAEVSIEDMTTHTIFTSYTSDGGWALFWNLNISQYLLSVNYLAGKYTHIPKLFYISDNATTTTLYDNLFKMAVFFSGDQVTIFHTLSVALPASIILTLPKYNNFSSLVDAYGLTYLDETIDFPSTNFVRYVFIPKDQTSPQIADDGSIFYPNYTVTVRMKSKIEGSVGITIASNASYILDINPMYTVPSDIWINVVYTVFVFKSDLGTQIESITVTLQEILRLLKAIDQNQTAYHREDKVWIDNAMTYLKGKLDPFTYDLLWQKVQDIDTNSKSWQRSFSQMSDELVSIIEGQFTRNLSDLRNTSTLLGLLAVGMIIVLAASIVVRKKSKIRTKGESLVETA